MAHSGIMKRLKALVPLFIVAGVVALLVYQLVAEGQVECRVCVIFQGRRQCATASGPDLAKAREEAQRSACSLLTSGVSEAFACPQVSPEEVACTP